MRLPKPIELKHATRGVNIFLLSKLGCEMFGSQLLYLWEIPVNEVQFRVRPHHTDPGPGQPIYYNSSLSREVIFKVQIAARA